MELPLFPLHAMLCPGVALPLHVFEPRYRALVARCRERREPFSVVLILAGREVGEPPGRLAAADTRTRLEGPNALLGREIALLGHQVKPLIVDPRPSAGRRN